MKICVLGAGSIGKRHVGNCVVLREELGITELRSFDTNPQRRSEVNRQYPDVVTCETLQEAVDGCDALIIGVPTSLHMPVIAEAVQYGPYHMYLEKPISHTLAGCDELVFRQQRVGKVLVVGYMLPKHPVLQEARRILESNILGRVLSVRAESGFYLPQWHPWEDYRDFYMAWKTGGGGALLDTSHEINYLQWLFGDIEEVQGIVGKVSDLEISSDDLAVAIFRFKNGIVGQVQLDLLQFDESRDCKVIGTEGVMIADLRHSMVRYNIKDEQAWKEIKLDVDFDTIYYDQLRDFVAACHGKPTDLITGAQAVDTMQVVEAVRRSHAYATTVRLPLFD